MPRNAQGVWYAQGTTPPPNYGTGTAGWSAANQGAAAPGVNPATGQAWASWDPNNPANYGKQALSGGAQTLGAAGDLAGTGFLNTSGFNTKNFYNDVLNNPNNSLWQHYGPSGDWNTQPYATSNPNQFAQPGAKSSINDVYGANAGAILGMPGTTQANGGVPLSSITGGNMFGTTGSSGAQPDTVGAFDPSATGGASSAPPGGTPTSSGGLPAYNPGESSQAYMTRIGMSPADQQAALAMAQQHPEMTFQQIMANGPTAAGINRSGAVGTSGSPATSGNFPAFNPGESPTAYMQRIGMNPTDIQSALAMAQQNPGMSFQDIMGKGGFSTGGGAGASSPVNNGSTGNNGVGLGTVANGGAQGTVNGVPGYTGGGSFDINNWKDPGYDFRLSEGNKLLTGNQAASGNYLSGPSLKALTQYGQDTASQEYQNAYNRFTGNRAFNYGVDTGDRSFDYMTQLGDQNYNLNLVNSLLGAGQFGAAGGANTNNLLATLLSNNALTAGQAGATNVIGGTNAVTGGINSAIGSLVSGNIMNRVFPQANG